jgi:hypothetical protein
VTDQDPIERQLQERLARYEEAKASDLWQAACDLARECAALRRLCREVLNDDRTIEQWSKLRAAGAGEEVL